MEISELIFPDEPRLMDPQHFERLMTFAHESGASDITIQSNERIKFQIHGKVIAVTEREMTDYEVEEAVRYIYGGNGVGRLKGGEAIDVSHQINRSRGEVFRFRVNMTACFTRGVDGIQITARTISATPPSLDFLGVEPEILNAAFPESGLVLVCGATGSGKSSLLSGLMASKISQADANIKLITAEAPIEYIYDEVPKPSSSVCQSEIPRHLQSFAEAMRNALRRAPDYILIGEARDRETISSSIEASETGHTVYSTVHSGSVHETLYRLVNAFSTEERDTKLYEIIEALRLVVVQRLLPRKGSIGRVALREFLEFTQGIRDELRDAQTVREAVGRTKMMVERHGRPFAVSAQMLASQGLIDDRYVRLIEAESRAQFNLIQEV